jgi:hypothetical protein
MLCHRGRSFRARWSNPLSIQLEINFGVDLHRHRLALEFRGFESPLAYGLDGFFVQPLADRAHHPDVEVDDPQAAVALNSEL